ncbi:MAG: tRNA lysidine(34) synthetase TilS [Bacteroidaceae bacterium]|nr:tRNA lysidine(34) synthetase TilS [Bacteroidaceae bacterium]
MNFVTSFERIVVQWIARENLFSVGEPLLVALSGGADSVALLRVLLRLGYRCDAAHCNFHLRGEESNRDEEFCRTLCRQLGVALHITHFDTQAYARQKGISIEMAARDLRYAWFEELCCEHDYTRVAVAHHRDDSVETLLLNLVRGTGLAGLTGIRSQNGRVVRPLSGVSRKEIVAYLKALGQEYVTDSTNLQDEFVRNKIRLQILPLLEKINPQVREKISATIDHLRGVEIIYEKSVQEALARVSLDGGHALDIPALMAEVEPRTILFEWLRPYGFVSAQVDEVFRSLTGESGRRFSNGAWELLKDRDVLLLRPYQLEGEDKCWLSVPQAPAEVPLAQGSMLVINHFMLSPDYQISRMANVATFDAAQVEFPLTIRPWQMGDKFAPFGMKGKKKLVSDLLTDLKLSRFEKEAQLIVNDARGRILWVVGRRTDERARVTEQTKEIIEIRLNSVDVV